VRKKARRHVRSSKYRSNSAVLKRSIVITSTAQTLVTWLRDALRSMQMLQANIQLQLSGLASSCLEAL